MRYLRKQVLNRRAPYDQRLSVDINNAVVMTTTNNLTLPSGTTAQRPVLPLNGMVRYNTTITELEVYQASTWRSLRFKESTGITQQNLGAGDSNNVYFGPLVPAPPLPENVQSGKSWGGQNLLVIVESVIQLASTNYTVVQNPDIPGEVYTGATSISSGGNIISFNTHVVASAASGNGTRATITFNTLPNVPFAVGSLIIVSGFRPTTYNGTYTVRECTTSTVKYDNVTTDTATVTGDVASSVAIYPSVDIVGAIVTGTNIQPGTTISSYTYDSSANGTNALRTITISPSASGTLATNAPITITDASNKINSGDYFLKFSSPVPYGKTVTVLHGFDK